MCLTLRFNTVRGLGSWGEAAVVSASCQSIPPSIWAITLRKGWAPNGWKLPGRTARFRSPMPTCTEAICCSGQWQGSKRRYSSAADCEEAEEASPEDTHACFKGGNYRLDQRGGAALQRLLSWSPPRPVHVAPTTWQNFLFCHWKRSEFLQTSSKNVCVCFLVSLWLRGVKSAVRPAGGLRTVFMSDYTKTAEQSLNGGSVLVKNRPH